MSRVVRGGITLVAGWLLSAGLVNGQAAAEAKVPLAEEVFKNIQVLKGIPVDEFMSTMGIFSAALGMSCENCHAADDRDWANYAGDNTPKKRTARGMVMMMAAINKNYFAGRQVVTCYSCHRGGDRPKTTPNLDAIYGHPPEEEEDDIVVQDPKAPTAEQILDKYIQARGGAQRLAGLTSYIAKGTSVGYGPESEHRALEIYAQAPGQRATIIHTRSGDNTITFDGRAAWHAEPLRPVTVVPLTGGELDGAKLDAEMAFPAQIKQVLDKWRVGRTSIVDDRKVQVVQGATASGALATLYFDDESGLLVRVLRYANSPVGRIPTQIDYSDYRDVAGVKMPFKWTFGWLDGRETVELASIQPNVPIDPAKFGKPAPPVAPVKR
jgi:photosynthetic reaction center cytochrome c subunit